MDLKFGHLGQFAAFRVCPNSQFQDSKQFSTNGNLPKLRPTKKRLRQQRHGVQ